jgi:hypothetical protein
MESERIEQAEVQTYMCRRIPSGQVVSFVVAVLVATGLHAQNATAPTEIDLKGDQHWVDAGIDVKIGDTIVITATGSLQYPQSKASGPEGLARGWKDLLRSTPVVDAGRGSVVGRIGSAETARPFLVGPRREMTAVRDGRLFVGINQPANDQAQGSFHVTIARTAAKVDTSKTNVNVRLPEITQAMLDQIPTRIGDLEGNAGDRVNFLMVGSEERVKQAFQAAGWVMVDRETKDAVLHGLIASLSKQAYLEMPMSVLYLFGRPQDFGYAHAEPIAVVSTRHHLRLWKAPFEVEGQTVWAGAATHDIGFERDQRNGKLTHKIDPEVDLEREFVAQSLNETGLVAKLGFLTPAKPVTEARTATGGGFRSDGRTQIIVLTPPAADETGKFADIFCYVLDQNADGGTWGACSQYLEAASQKKLPLTAIPNKYRLLIVPGIMNSCASAAPAFDEGQKVLRDKHGMTVELLAVPNDASEVNAKTIAQYLKDHSKDDQRKYIVLGYSKGAPDLQTMLATEKEAVGSVAAFVTVAGAVGGSPIADFLPAQLDKYMQMLKFGNCKGDVSTGFKSLRRDVRRAFLASFPNPIVPTYSIAAVSDQSNTSKMLLESWKLLSVYDSKHDSQLTRQDSIVPGAKYLGTARADHLAVGLPLEKMADKSMLSFLDHGSYPRAALLESIVRYVVQDLETAK